MTSKMFNQLEQGIDEEEHNQVLDYLSQWSFERMLDRLASLIQKCLAESYKMDVGCALLYRVSKTELRYVVGGSSTQRMRMDPSARRYVLHENAEKRSFTAYSLRFGQPLAFDDFHQTTQKLKHRLTHQSKSCELAESETKSYVSIPAAMSTFNKRAKVALKCKPDELPRSPKFTDNKLPPALLRITFAQKGAAKRTLQNFLENGTQLLERLFALITKGSDALGTKESSEALAIADLNGNLLRYRFREYLCLEALATHLQTVFGECECSIWRAHPVNDKVHLYLAATTALSNDDQHRKFRRKFFGEREHYTCAYDPPNIGEPIPKTARAYYWPDTPIYEPNSLGKGGFPQHGEWTVSTSYLALAIPSNSPEEKPYGVIRLVRGASNSSAEDTFKPFSGRDKRLAAAIAKTLNFWQDLFPRNDELQIEWESENLKRDTLRTLFNIKEKRELQEAEIEFNALLCKLFVTANNIKILRAYSGYSGAAVLAVQSNIGREVILKCATKVNGIAADPISHKNSITDEVINYVDFIEGKVLNHNVIYPHRIRETRQVNGFVSSFVGSGLRTRRTLADLVTLDTSPTEFFTLLTGAVDHIVLEIWKWWYEHPKRHVSRSVNDFVNDALLPNDLLWHLSHDAVLALDNIVIDAASAIRYPLDNEHWPSSIWRDFQQWSTTSGEVRWSECVTHGDLHGGNIFIDPQSAEVWLIDFAKTGHRLSVFDLATLEVYTKFQFLPTLLRKQNLVFEKWCFVESFMNIERVWARQTSYNKLSLPVVETDENPKALDALNGAVRVVTQIRTHLHNSLHREGTFLDYLVALFLLSFRYMNVRGASAVDRDNLQILLAALSSVEILKSLREEFKFSESVLNTHQNAGGQGSPEL